MRIGEASSGTQKEVTLRLGLESTDPVLSSMP